MIVSPDTLLRWHRALLRRGHAKASRKHLMHSPKAYVDLLKKAYGK
ncbi:hypothetical protein [Streptomyces aureus]